MLFGIHRDVPFGTDASRFESGSWESGPQLLFTGVMELKVSPHFLGKNRNTNDA
jgi:hypothetical protein